MPDRCGQCQQTIPDVVSYCPYCGTACQRKRRTPVSPLLISLAGVLALLVGMVAWQLTIAPR